jgi:hypothetical protein
MEIPVFSGTGFTMQGSYENKRSTKAWACIIGFTQKHVPALS